MERNALPHLLRARDWQDRPEFAALCEWWRSGGSGVAALVGIGGAGKTAIADRFLQVLPGAYPEHPKVLKDATLKPPARLFVFSFYDAPNPDSFFADLAVWLNAEQALSYPQTIQRLASAGRCLLVLDGLEKAQDDGLRGGAFGQLLDGRLRDFVLRAADGYLPDVSVVVTSRFRLYDPLVMRAWYYTQIPVEQLDAGAAIQLLRERGVQGTNDELEHVASEQGFHALSVDLAGGYIARFCNGDPEVFSRFNVAIDSDAAVALDPRVAAIREQERRFSRLATRYHEALADSDPAALALLQRVCLFRLGIDAETLTTIFTGEGKEHISGAALAALTPNELATKLNLLAEMRLIEESKSTGRKAFTVHPAVRDGFSRRIDAETARIGHDAARSGLETSLGGKTGTNPSDPATLDLLEEILYHTLAAGEADGAWRIYNDRMGGERNIAWRLGAFERGERICRAFVRGSHPATAVVQLAAASQRAFFFSWAHYLLHLGQLGMAEAADVRSFRASSGSTRERIAFESNITYLNSLSGRLSHGTKTSATACNLARRSAPFYVSLAYGSRALIAALRGSVAMALRNYSKVTAIFVTGRGSRESLLLRLGSRSKALKVTSTDKREHQGASGINSHGVAVSNVLIAEIKSEQEKLPAARRSLHEAYEWALAHDDKHLLIWSALVSAKIEQKTKAFDRAKAAVEDGLRIAHLHGYGIDHIDLLLLRARISLHEGRGADAEKEVRLAIDEGIHPPPDSGLPVLLAANDPECGYAWGIAEGRHLLAEAILLQIAQHVGSATVPTTLTAEIARRIKDAKAALKESIKLWKKLRDPESDADINPNGIPARETLKALDRGALSSYFVATPAVAKRKARRAKPAEAKRFRVALSFPGEERTLVEAIAEELGQQLTKKKVFYDKFHEHETARPNLDVYLQSIYRDQSDLVVVFVSSNYENKQWCHLEWRAIREIIKDRRDDEVMFIRTDSGKVGGLFSIDGYIDAAGRPPIEIVDAILKRLESIG